MVPARRFLFNTDGLVLAVTIVAVAIAALVLGFLFDAKAGFCNSICPVLPVERLYGRHPLLMVPNVRCAPCTVCTKRGCVDLSSRSAELMLGPAVLSGAWLRRGYGVFAAAFPGFVVGYYLRSDGPLAVAGATYLTVALGAAVSYLAVTALVTAFRIPAGPALTGLAAAAVGLYYWFAAPVLADAVGQRDSAAWVIRAAALALVVNWYWRSLVKRNGGVR